MNNNINNNIININNKCKCYLYIKNNKHLYNCLYATKCKECKCRIDVKPIYHFNNCKYKYKY